MLCSPPVVHVAITCARFVIHRTWRPLGLCFGDHHLRIVGAICPTPPPANVISCCLFVSKFLGWLDDPVQSRIAIKGSTEKYLKENVGKLAFIRLIFYGFVYAKFASSGLPCGRHIWNSQGSFNFLVIFLVGIFPIISRFEIWTLFFSKLALNNKIVERILYRPVGPEQSANKQTRKE